MELLHQKSELCEVINQTLAGRSAKCRIWKNRTHQNRISQHSLLGKVLINFSDKNASHLLKYVGAQQQ